MFTTIECRRIAVTCRLSNVRMKPKLISLFLIVGLVPLGIATCLTYWLAADALTAGGRLSWMARTRSRMPVWMARR